MKAIIVEDETRNTTHLQNLVTKHCPGVQIVGTAASAEEGVLSIVKEKPDLVFLDIEIGDRTGFDVLGEIGRYNFEVIFVTAHDQYALRAIKCSALDYILKPIKVTELVLAVDKALQKTGEKQTAGRIGNLLHQVNTKDRNDHLIVLPFLKEYRYVRPAEIVRCEAMKSYTVFFLSNGEKLTVSKLMKEYDELLTPYSFIRCHQSHLVNRKFIKSLSKEDTITELVLLDKTRVPVAKTRRGEVKEFMEGRSLP